MIGKVLIKIAWVYRKLSQLIKYLMTYLQELLRVNHHKTKDLNVKASMEDMMSLKLIEEVDLQSIYQRCAIFIDRNNK